MPRPARAVIDLARLQRNYFRAAALAAPAQTIAVVKADGYGHGIVPVAEALAPHAPGFAVALLEEAQAVRAAVPVLPILLMEGIHDPADWQACAGQGFIPVIHSPEQLADLEKAPLDCPVSVWIKVNTGMNRLGFRPWEVAGVLQKLELIPQASVEGLMTHFACADDPSSQATQAQIKEIEQLRAQFPRLTISAANSAAHYTTSAGVYEFTRPGVMLYGASPVINKSAVDLGLEAVMTLESQLIAVRELAPGEAVGYGADWRAQHATRMGIVALGYGDGYPRHAPSGTPLVVEGVRVPLIGRVSMDMLAVDLGQVPYARPGSPVELWGSKVGVDEVANAAGTIGYDLLTGVTARVLRVYRP